MNQNPPDRERSSQAPGSPPASDDGNPVKQEILSTKAQGEEVSATGFDAKKKRGVGRRWPKIEGYEIQGILGEGGMGVVYRARNVNLNRAVAIKMILSGTSANAQSLERFANEIKSISRLQHRSIIQILDAGSCQDQPYFVMEFVDGHTLAKRNEERPFTFREAAELSEQLALAMEYAHRQCVIHRDLKPTNILLTPDGVPKIMDFGIAKRSDFARDLTATGVILGTPGYLSPEQAEGRSTSIGPGSDVFALGVMLYEMLAGQRPFDGLSEVEVMKQIIHDDPPSPAWYRPSIPGDLETICLKCLNKARAKRYLTAAELAADLRRYLEGQVIHARPATLFEKSNKWIRRNPVRFAGAATVGLLIIASVGGLFWDNRQRTQSLARTKRLAGYGSEFSMWVIRHHMVRLDDVNGSTDLKKRLSGKVQRFLDATSQLTEFDSEFNHRMGVAYQNLAELQGNPFANNLGQVNESRGLPISSNRLVELKINSNIAKCYIARETQDIEAGVLLLDELDRQIHQFSDDPRYAESREFYLTWLAGAKGYLCRLQGDSENAIIHLLEQRRLTQVKFDRDPESLYSRNHLAVGNTYLG